MPACRDRAGALCLTIISSRATSCWPKRLAWKPTSGARWRRRTTLRLDNLASQSTSRRPFAHPPRNRLDSAGNVKKVDVLRMRVVEGMNRLGGRLQKALVLAPRPISDLDIQRPAAVNGEASHVSKTGYFVGWIPHGGVASLIGDV